MSESIPTSQILCLSFFGATLLGLLMRQTNFCTMGAIADCFLMSDYTRLRQWLLAIGVAILGAMLLSIFELIDITKSIYSSSRLMYLSTLIGSLCFGFGMVLTSGCGGKTLIRIGGGSLKSLIVFIVLGLFAYFTMRGFLAVLRVNMLDTFFIDLAGAQDVPSVLAQQFNFDRTLVHLYLGLTLGLVFILLSLIQKSFWTANNLLAGIGIGFLVIAFWWVSGSLAHLSEDPNTLEEVFLLTNSGKMESLSFVAPFAYSLDWLMFYSDTSRVLTIGVIAVTGVIFGSFVHALISKTFRWESFSSAKDMAHHLLGAALMGFGGVLALGCTIGQGISAISTLALSSFIALPGFVVGAYVALRYLERSEARSPCA
jgi:uncharacterized membrane protein YedE/YeeE